MDKLLVADMDDILCRWIPEFNQHLINLGYDLGPEGVEYIPKNWGYTELNVPYSVVQEYIESCPNHAPYQEMIDSINSLKAKGWSVVVVTSHPTNLMMERVEHLNSLGLKYDHIALTLSFDREGKVISLSKAKYIEKVYKKENNVILFVDDRAKSVVEFVELGLGYGFTVDRSYNSAEMEHIQDNPVLERRVFLGRGNTMKDQLLDLIPQLEAVADRMNKNIFAKV